MRFLLGILSAWVLFPAGVDAADFEALRSSGAGFVVGEARLPLRALEQVDLLALSQVEREKVLDRAAAAGFNAVLFRAPLFGAMSFSQTLGKFDPAKARDFMALLNAMALRRLYAFPVLWDALAYEAFSTAGGGEEKFLTGKIQTQWQAWLATQLMRSDKALGRHNALGGWIIYRGAWAGPSRGAKKIQGSQAHTAAMRAWVAYQVRAMRAAGAKQLMGVDFLLKGDLGRDRKSLDADLGHDSLEDLAPLSEPPPISMTTQSLAAPEELDRLPPVPGSDLSKSEGEALTPWDLEGLDWDEVGRALTEVPAGAGVDFLVLTLDTEDWYRVGDAMGEEAREKALAPVLWRQDWRAASRYERQKHLEAPEGVAGLAGPWPDKDWPEPNEQIWPSRSNKPGSADMALIFKFLEVSLEDKTPVITLHLNRPSEIDMAWGRSWPLGKRLSSKEPALVHRFKLKGAKMGDQILLQARASSKRWGRANMRPRWVALKPALASPSRKP